MPRAKQVHKFTWSQQTLRHVLTRMGVRVRAVREDPTRNSHRDLKPEGSEFAEGKPDSYALD